MDFLDFNYLPKELLFNIINYLAVLDTFSLLSTNINLASIEYPFYVNKENVI